MEETMHYCESCRHLFPTSELKLFEGLELCPDCFNSATVLCADCGRRIWTAENAGTGSHPLCQSCYDRSYVHCACCGHLIHEDDAYYDNEDSDEPFCYDCYSRRRSEGIHDYYFKPAPIFYGTGPRYMGVELEIDEGGEDNQSAREILDIVNGNGEERAYCKHDGSLDDGFEIVTHPMTIDYHLHTFPWAEVVRKAISMGYTSHQAGTCGLHVHVSRLAFGNTEEQQDDCIARILYFFERNWEELLKFSRRTRRQLDQWAARYGYKDQPQEILEHAKSGNLGRYACVNLTNTDTIEFRIFRGTLKLNTLLATLQMVNRICDIALYLSDKEVKDLSWSSFVSGCQEPELIQYLKERRLYVNEPVSGEGEI